MRKSFAPFSAEQIQPINEYQLGLSLSAGVGPLVCPHRDTTPHGDVGGRKGVLLASEAGLHCLYCGHTQNWVYSLMLRKNTLDFADKELVRWTEPRLIQLISASLQERAIQAMGSHPVYPYEAPDRLDALIEEAFRCLHRRQLAYFDIELRPGHDYCLGEPWINVEELAPAPSEKKHGTLATAVWAQPKAPGAAHRPHGVSHRLARQHPAHPHRGRSELLRAHHALAPASEVATLNTVDCTIQALGRWIAQSRESRS